MGDIHDHRVLIPVDILGGQGVPSTIVDAFASVPVVVLGYHEIPDQTAPEQARSRFEEQATAKLEDLRTVFEAADCDVTTRLVFTHDRFTTFERVAVELECDGVLIPNPAPILERILVTIRGDVNVDHIARLVGMVLTGTEIDVTLFHVVSSDTDDAREQGQALLERAASILVELGIDRDRIESTVVAGSPTDAIFEAATDHHLIVAGESRPSIARFVFRDRAKRIARRTVDPVLVIRGEYLESDTAETESEEELEEETATGSEPNDGQS